MVEVEVEVEVGVALIAAEASEGGRRVVFWRWMLQGWRQPVLA